MNRAGRFDRAYEIGLPDEELRLEYMKMRGFGIFLSEGEIKTPQNLQKAFPLHSWENYMYLQPFNGTKKGITILKPW